MTNNSQAVRLPVMFIGHGSPMNAIERNTFSDTWREIGAALFAGSSEQAQMASGQPATSGHRVPREQAQMASCQPATSGHRVPREQARMASCQPATSGHRVPRAIVAISAHWLTRGTQITSGARQKTIHDFGGFPPALYAVEYPAPGSRDIAQEIADALENYRPVALTEDWGLDHGTWSVLMHMRPAADVPVLQISIDATASPDVYFALGERLRPLRERGILFIGSGNIVHNLQLVDWNRLNERGFAHEWARDADQTITRLIDAKDWQRLIDWQALPHNVQLAINRAEHYVPLLYILGLSHADEQAQYFNAEAVGGALTMTSLRFG